MSSTAPSGIGSSGIGSSGIASPQAAQASSQGKKKDSKSSSKDKDQSESSGTLSGEKASDAQKLAMIEYVTSKRVANLDYIRRVHEVGVYWLNVVKISSEDILKFVPAQVLQKR